MANGDVLLHNIRTNWPLLAAMVIAIASTATLFQRVGGLEDAVTALQVDVREMRDSVLRLTVKFGGE